MKDNIKAMRDYVRGITDFVPEVALTLGSGLGSFAENITVSCEVPYSDIPGFPVSTAPGHAGKLVFGYLGKTPIVCLNGRVHLYEGYAPEQVVTPVRLVQALGAKILFLTNAAGGLKKSYTPGTLALITDQISSFVPNPLIGPNDDDEGVRFPDMTCVYDLALRDIVKQTAKELDIDLDEGVYVQLTGPSFETPAEIRMVAALGGDIVGMSTVVEAITARHCGMRVVGISLISNLAAGISKTLLSSEEVNEAGAAAAPRFTKLVAQAIQRF